MINFSENKTDSKPQSNWLSFFAKGRSTPDLTAHLIFWPVAIIGLVADLWTKHAVFAWLPQKSPNSYSIIDSLFQFVIAQNAGAAFGIAAGKRTLLVSVSILAIIIILLVFLTNSIKQRLAQLALAFFAAGVCGNLYDRIFNQGLVRDFIDIYYKNYHWPAFNLADSMLCVGVALLLISVVTDSSAQEHVQQHK